MGSGDDCPLQHQRYHFRSRGFLPSVPRAFQSSTQDGRRVPTHCGGPLVPVARDYSSWQRQKKKKHGLLMTGTMRSDWLCGRIRALHRNLVRIIPWQLRRERERTEQSSAGFSGRLHDLIRRISLKPCILSPKPLSGYCVWPVTQCLRISHLQVEWMQHFIHKRESLEMIRCEGTHFIARVYWRDGTHFHRLYVPLTYWVIWMCAGQLSMHGAAAN